MKYSLLTCIVCCMFFMANAQSDYNEKLDVQIVEHNIVLQDHLDLKIYPNPIVDQFRVDLKAFRNKEITLTILQDTEVLYKRNIVKVKNNTLQLSAYALRLNAGSYVVEISEDTKMYRKKIMIL